MFWRKQKNSGLKDSVGGLTPDYTSLARSLQKAKFRNSLRVFVSHRWELDAQILAFIESFEAREAGINVVDLSLKEETRIAGPLGGMVEEHKVKQDIAARIFASDVVIAPSKRMQSTSDWVKWELQTAAICYNLPIIFMDHVRDLEHPSALVRELSEAGAKILRCGPDTLELVRAINAALDLIVPEDPEEIEIEEIRKMRSPRDYDRIVEENDLKPVS